MPVLAILFLAVAAAILGRTLKSDGRKYAAFKAAETTEQRQAYLRRWLLQSFGFYFLFPIVALACLGQLGALIAFPPTFAPLNDTFGVLFDHPQFLIGFAIAYPLGLAALIVVARRRRKAGVLPEYGALIPRNAAERRWVVLLSLNAGLSEETFFRLFLPLLLTLLVGHPGAVFAGVTALFGLVHRYQGWKGVIGTMVIGGLLAFVYLATQSLALAMAVHAGFNLNALILVPLRQISRQRRAAGRSAGAQAS